MSGRSLNDERSMDVSIAPDRLIDSRHRPSRFRISAPRLARRAMIPLLGPFATES